MAYGKNEVVTGMDRVAKAVTNQDSATGIARRVMIFGNLVFMAASIAGLVLTTQGQNGLWLVFVAMASSGAYSGVIEYQQRGKAPRDERESAIFWKALAIGASRGPAFLDPGGGKQRTHDFLRRHAVGWRIRRLKMCNNGRSRGRVHLAGHVFLLEIAQPPQQALDCRHLLGPEICEAVKARVRQVSFP